MYKFLLMSIFYLSSLAMAAVDFSHCIDYLKNNKSLDHLMMTENGKVGAYPDKVHSIGRGKDDPSNITFVKIKQDADNENLLTISQGEIIKGSGNNSDITINHSTFAGTSQQVKEKKVHGFLARMYASRVKPAKTTIRFKVRNNKCYPASVRSEPQVYNFLRPGMYQMPKVNLIDVEKCKKISDFFEKNPFIEKCTDKNMWKELSGILSGKVKEESSFEKLIMALSGNDKDEHAKERRLISRADDKLIDCKLLGLDKVLKDEELWKVKSSDGAGSEGSSVVVD